MLLEVRVLSTTDALIDFGIKVITEDNAKLIGSFAILLYPPAGFVSFLNDTDCGIIVDTFDQDDVLRWISYERRAIAPHQAVLLGARGSRIHIHVLGHARPKFDCDKGQAYLFDGHSVHPKIS